MDLPMEKAVQTRPRESHLWQTSLWLPPGGRTKQNNNDLQLQIPQLWYTIGDKQFIWLSPGGRNKKKSRFTAENSEPVVNFGTNLTLTCAQSTDKKNSIFFFFLRFFWGQLGLYFLITLHTLLVHTFLCCWGLLLPLQAAHNSCSAALLLFPTAAAAETCCS